MLSLIQYSIIKLYKKKQMGSFGITVYMIYTCLLYTSDAADE